MKVLLILGFIPAIAAARPNILILFADDLGRYASAYADPEQPSPNDLLRTPVFDRIAREGTLFHNAFVSAPSCTPSRGALYTGRHFFRNGSFSQLHSRWQQGVPDPGRNIVGMPAVLKNHGYHVGWTLKTHIPTHLMGGKEGHHQKAGTMISHFSQAVTRQPENRDKALDQVRQNFRDFLAKREGDQPLFYSFNPTNTHRPWVPGSGKALWNLDPESLKGRLPPFLPDHHVIREDFADYLGEAMAFDAACGVLLEELERLGEQDDTIVIISGDHGAPGFPRGKTEVHDFGSRVLLAVRWPSRFTAGNVIHAPVSLVDLAPTVLAAAECDSPDDPDGQNLVPVLCNEAGPQTLRGWALIGREVHYGDARDEYLPYPVRALRTADWLYVRNFKPTRWPMGAPRAAAATPQPDFSAFASKTGIAYSDFDASPTKAWMLLRPDDPELQAIRALSIDKRPGEELYDLRKDPHQQQNLAADPAHTEDLKRLRAALMKELRTGKDPRLEDDFDRPPYCIPSHWPPRKPATPGR
jgi:uncharacterized sulfatase